MFKKEHLNEIIYNYKIIYILCLSDWYKTNTKVELKYLKKYNIPFFRALILIIKIILLTLLLIINKHFYRF